ncbi:major facilitator superfamily domain-containing protein [Microdochium bolleyi]|uniref:Major facilitator superfamily domain-containing protein n=1 Tax=Microdochium bolleyi TaxID=196109 RepID=A0A136IV27_9PEZI|nr:major facilitator superfamily domain-containing protein [Microdochium bolleyi]
MESPRPNDRDRVFDAVPPLSSTSRVCITSLLVAANTIQFISNFITFAGGRALTQDLGMAGAAGKANWMPAAYPLTQSAFVLITGRLGEIYGHKRMALAGCLIFGIFSLVNAFCRTFDSFIAARALTGLGGGFFMPNAVSMITTMIPPGRTRNLFLGFFAASPPLGGMIGALLTGVFLEGVGWMWLFVLVAASTAFVLGWLVYITPKEKPVDSNGKLDYVGAFFGVSSLLLFNIVCNQAPSAGWSSAFTIACLTVTGLMFGAFLVWETRYATDPVMPLGVFRAPSFSALVWVVLLSYMSFGVAQWYAVLWQQSLRHASVLETGIRFVPFGLASLLAVFAAAWLMSRVAAQWIMAVGVGAALAASLLLATMPVSQTYWAQVFPAMVLSGFCPDFVYVAAQVIASSSVGRRQQGVASSLIGTLNLYGTSLGLGLAAIVETQVVERTARTGDDGEVLGFRAALYFAAAVALIGLLLDVLFVRMPKNEREGWEDEDPAVPDQVELPEASTTSASRLGVTRD